MSWTDNYDPTIPDFDLDQWLIDNGYGDSFVDGITVGEEMSDYTSADGTDPITDPDTVSDLWTIDSVSGNPFAVGGIEAHMWQWMQNNPTAGNELFGAELFTQMFLSANPGAQEDFIENWNDSFSDAQIEFTNSLNAGDIAMMATQWGNLYGPGINADIWFPENSGQSTNELGNLIAQIEAETALFNDQWLDGTGGWDALVGEAIATGETQFQAAATKLLDDYNNQVKEIQQQGAKAKSDYGFASDAWKSKEASRGVHKKRGNFLEDGSVDMKKMRNTIKGLNTAKDYNVDQYEVNTAMNQNDWEAYLSALFGVGGYEGNYNLAYQGLLNQIDSWVATYNTSVGEDAQDQFSQMWEFLDSLSLQGGILPPTGGGFDDQYWWQDQDTWEGDWDDEALGGNCVLPSGSYGIWCNEATDYPNMCVEVPSESWVDPCYQGQMMPGGDVIGWDDWDVDNCCPEGQEPDWEAMGAVGIAFGSCSGVVCHTPPEEPGCSYVGLGGGCSQLSANNQGTGCAEWIENTPGDCAPFGYNYADDDPFNPDNQCYGVLCCIHIWGCHEGGESFPCDNCTYGAPCCE